MKSFHYFLSKMRLYIVSYKYLVNIRAFSKQYFVHQKKCCEAFYYLPSISISLFIHTTYDKKPNETRHSMLNFYGQKKLLLWCLSSVSEGIYGVFSYACRTDISVQKGPEHKKIEKKRPCDKTILLYISQSCFIVTVVWSRIFFRLWIGDFLKDYYNEEVVIPTL